MVKNASTISASSVEQRLSHVLERGLLALWEADLASGRILWSSNIESILGLPESRRVKTLREFIGSAHPDDRGPLKSSITSALKGRELTHSHRFRILRPDGSVRHLVSHAQFEYTGAEVAGRIVGTTIDLTELVSAEEALRESEHRLMAAYEAAKVWTWQLDLDRWTIKRPLQTGSGAAPNFGEDQPFDDWTSRIHPSDRERVRTGLRSAAATGALWEDEFRVQYPDGEYHWVYDRGRRVNGCTIMAGAALDVTQRKIAEAQLRDNAEYLQQACAVGKLWPWEIDVENLTVTRPAVYPGAKETFANLGAGMPLVGFLETVHPDDRERTRKLIFNTIETGAEYYNELRIRTVDGSYMWAQARARLMKDGSGRRLIRGIGFDYQEQRMIVDALRESERLRELALNAAEMGLFRQDLRTGKLYWSERQYQLFDVEPEGFDGTVESGLQRVHPEDYRRLHEETEELLRKRATRNLNEMRVIRRDGHTRWIALVGEITYAEDGTPLTLVGVNYDITDRRLQEQALRDSESFRRFALQAANMGAFQWDVKTNGLRWSEEESKLFGLAPGTFDGRLETFLSHVVPEDLPILQEWMSGILSGRVNKFSSEFRIRTSEGETRWLGGLGEVSLGPDGRPERLIGVNWDITQAKQSQDQILRLNQELQNKVADFEALMSSMPVAVAIGLDPESKIIQVNQTFREMLQVEEGMNVSKSSEEGQRTPFRFLRNGRELLPEELPQQIASATGKEVRDSEFMIELPDGEARDLFGHAIPLFDEHGAVRGTVAAFMDISERKRYENDISQLNSLLEEKLRETEAIVSSVPIGLAFATDPDCLVVKANSVMRAILGVPLAENISASTAIPAPFAFYRDGRKLEPKELPMEVAARTATEIRGAELEVHAGDGQVRWVIGDAVPLLDAHGKTRGAIGAFMDVTERKRSEEMLRTSEKLATAGRMAASLAHEINNPLAAVTNLLYLIRQDSGLNQNSRRFAEMAASELDRVSHITKNMLAFYRDSTLPIDVDLSELIGNVLELYDPKIRESRVEVRMERAKAHTVFAFPGELRQVCSNLIVNAIEAMPKGGVLRVRTRKVGNGTESRIRVTIADTGTGVAPEQLAHIYEPFYTTKGEKGTGLGLWVSRDIIAKHGGSIRLRTSRKPGRSGTCFSIWLPVKGRKLRQVRAEAVSN